MISDRVKNFILSNRDLIDIPGEELVAIANEKLLHEELKEFYSILKSIGIDIDKERWEFFENSFLKIIDYYKSSSDGPANDWSRLDYILEVLGMQGFEYEEIVNHLIKFKDKLNLKMEHLDALYGWTGGPDYDLGWFDKEEAIKSWEEEEEY